MEIKEKLIVTKISEPQNMRNNTGKQYRKIHMVVAGGDNAGTQYHTFVSESYVNYRWWKKVVKSYDEKNGLLPVIQGKFRVNKNEINADSKHFEMVLLFDTKGPGAGEFMELLYERMTGRKPVIPLRQVAWGNFIE